MANDLSARARTVVATLVVAFWVAHIVDSHKGYPYDVNTLAASSIIKTKK